MPATTPVLSSEDFPALHRSANQHSLNAQYTFLLWFKIRLGGLVVAAMGGSISWTIHGRPLVGGAVAVVAFAAALAAELVLAIQRPDRIWYEGRAAAESATTLTWCYMVRGEPFGGNVADADKRFLNELRDILHDRGALALRALSDHEVQISAKMRKVRALPFADRRAVYLAQRIQNQQGWYANKAAWNTKRATFWLVTGVALEFLGLSGGVAKAVGLVSVDLLGIFAAAAAAAAAWLQAKQHENLATAYGVTSLDLAAVATERDAVTDESAWAQFVAGAEEAISREHTPWRASRGVGVQPRRP